MSRRPRGARGSRAGARGLVAATAARLIAEEGVVSYRAARDKAVRRLGLGGARDLPSPLEIEQALADHLRLFRGPAHLDRLAALRRHAAEAMRLLAEFEPRLTGRVLSGTAGEHTPITLHLFTDSAEDVGFFLIDRAIPYRLGDKRYRDADGRWRVYPSYVFVAGDAEIELVVFPALELRQAPPSPLDGRPMARAGLAEVEAMVDALAREPHA